MQLLHGRAGQHKHSAIIHAESVGAAPTEHAVEGALSCGGGGGAPQHAVSEVERVRDVRMSEVK